MGWNSFILSFATGEARVKLWVKLDAGVSLNPNPAEGLVKM